MRSCLLQQHAVRTLKDVADRGDDEKAADAQRAVTDLHNARELFKALVEKAQAEQAKLDLKTVAIHLKFCESTLQDAERVLEQVGGPGLGTTCAGMLCGLPAKQLLCLSYCTLQAQLHLKETLDAPQQHSSLLSSVACLSSSRRTAM